MKTTKAIATGLLLGAALIAIAALTGCAAPRPSWTEFNPLDQPGHSEPTVAELHAGNIAEITSDPTRVHR